MNDKVIPFAIKTALGEKLAQYVEAKCLCNLGEIPPTIDGVRVIEDGTAPEDGVHIEVESAPEHPSDRQLNAIRPI